MSTSAPHLSPLNAELHSASATHTHSRSAAPAATGKVPWYIWTGVFAVTSASIGGAWDVSWHRTIGRDSFWTPAHLAIQLCAVLAAIIGIWLTARATFTRDAQLRAESISVFGLRAPFGVFLAGWGGLAMLTSAPFDNWWHNAYGLDVKIISPPHTLLILGIRAVSFGIFFLILAAMNRSAESGDANYNKLRNLFLWMGGLALGGQMFFLQEDTWDIVLHRSLAYVAMAIAVPLMFAIVAQASRFRWACTTIAGVYTFMLLAEILILPLVPGVPKLGPVYNPVTHLVPGKFPILLLVPALALDIFWHRVRAWKLWQIAIVSGVIFVATLFVVEWPFASFLMSKASQNRFFGTIYFDYDARPKGYDRMRLFLWPQSGMVLWLGLLRASICAMISTWLGLLFGRWMKSVQR